MLITPEYVFKDVTHITPEFLAGKGIRALVLDIDNTLTADRSQELPDEVAGWLAQMKEADIGLTIVSNGAEKRVRPFAEKLGLAYLYRSAKPLPFALMVARRRMGVKRKQMAMVGDQLYADRFEKKNAAVMGHGLCFNKYTGSRGKSGSNDADAEYMALVRDIMDEAGVDFQTCELGRIGAGGGGTIAFILAEYGMDVIDSGVAVLSMHALWEVTNKADVYEAYKGYKAFIERA